MDAYDLFGACTAITGYLDALTNWYIRRSRDRFWRARDGGADAEQDKADAYDTLSTVLVTLCRVAAPLLPLLTENVFQGLTGERSVHLTDWPAPTTLPADAELVETMDLVREVCSAAHAIRKAQGRRARLPLRTLTVATADPDRLRPFIGLIADEVNVKEVVFSEDLEDVAERVLTLVPSVLGPRLGSDAPKVFAAMKKGDWTVSDTAVIAGGISLEPGDYELVLRPRNPDEGRTLPGDVGVVTLDITVDAALQAEGSARDVIRLVQAERREAGLHVSDCISLELEAPAAVIGAVEAHRTYVAEQTLAVDLRLSVAETQSIRITKAPCSNGS
jgi:isoleucyl-tRNA synthetase